jgi:hypothetical protein
VAGNGQWRATAELRRTRARSLVEFGEHPRALSYRCLSSRIQSSQSPARHCTTCDCSAVLLLARASGWQAVSLNETDRVSAPRNQATTRPCQRFVCQPSEHTVRVVAATCPPSGPLRTNLSSSARSSASSTACRPARRRSTTRSPPTTTSRPR